MKKSREAMSVAEFARTDAESPKVVAESAEYGKIRTEF
jgi:hypothetical protein